MSVITARIIQSTGLNANVSALIARELGITSDTEQPVIGSTVGGPKYLGTEQVINITTPTPAAIPILRRSRGIIIVDTTAAGANVALNIQNGAQITGYFTDIIVIGTAGRKCTITYGAGLTIDIYVGYNQPFMWLGSLWGLITPDALTMLDLIKTVDGPGSGLDAATVSGYGIGVIPTILTTPNLNTYKTNNGNFACNSPTFTNDGFETGAISSFSGNLCIVVVEMYSTTHGKQTISIPQTAFSYERYLINGLWYGWYTVWTIGSDGNGGQPPAPRPRAYSSDAVGEWKQVTGGDGATVRAPTGGTWAVLAFYVTSLGSMQAVYFNTGATAHVAVVAGGSNIVAGQAGKSSLALCWRVAS